MAVAGQVAVKFTADIAQYITATEKLQKQNKEMGASADGIAKQFKKMFGEESGFGLLGKTLAGAGVFAGITAITNAVGHGAQRVAEMNAQYKAGKIDAAEWNAEIAKSIPILGGLFEAGAHINELITGEKAYVEALKEEVALNEKRLAQNKAYIDATTKLARATQDLRDRAMKPGFVTDFLGIWKGAERSVADLPGQINKDYGEQLKTLVEQQAAAQAALAKAQADARPRATPTGPGGKGGIEPPTKAALGAVADAQNTLNVISARVADLKAKMGEYQRAAETAVGSGVVVGGLKLINNELVAGAQKLTDYVGRWWDWQQKSQTIAQSQADLAFATAKGVDELTKAAVTGMQRWADDNKRLAEEAMTPLEKYKQVMEDLQRRHNVPWLLGGIDDKTFNALAEKARKEMKSSSGSHPFGLAPSVTPQLSAQFTANTNTRDTVQGQQLDELKKASGGIDKLIDAVNDTWRSVATFTIAD